MLNFLNALSFRSAMFWMLVILGIFLIVEIAVFAILMIYKKHKAPAEKSRQAVSITLDTQIVKRVYKVGEKFDPSGLIVTARYNGEPFEETLQEFTVVTPELVKQLARDGKQPDDLLGCRIYAPDLSVEGKPTVTVAYLNQTAAYAISVEPSMAKSGPVEPQAVVETVNYTVNVVAPEELDSLQVALYSGDVQVGLAANVVDGEATIAAPVGDYMIKVHGLPDDGYVVTAGLLSEDNLTVTVTIDREAPEEENVEPEAVEVIPEVELVDYNILVNAPEELSTLQVALYNGNEQVGQAANVVNGSAVIAAPAGNYIVKVFGISEDDYEVYSELLSETRRSTIVTVTYSDDADVKASEEEMCYEITVVAPEEMKMQVGLCNGKVQVGYAVNVREGKATIKAPVGEFHTKVFCLPDGYEASVELVSATKPSATVYVTPIEYVEDQNDTVEDDELAQEEEIPTVSEIIKAVSEEPELVEYNIIVNGVENLPSLQIALLNGEEQIGQAVNVESGTATILAQEGDYIVKLFGLPEGYEASPGTVTVRRHICTVTVTAPVQEATEELAVAEDAADAEVEQPEVIVQPAEPVVIVEESFEGGILRYDRSFTARLIQSDNEIKDWYTELKNELLSYKKVHDRMSWKRESYNFGRLPFARLAYRGDTLCLYLPLDPESLADSKYKVESVADNTSYQDTPCLYRIKNNKRVKYAKELIAATAELLQTPRIERESQDYYLPYEGLVELINKKLVKRNIKSKADEAIFVASKTEN